MSSGAWCELPLLVCSTFSIKDWKKYLRERTYCNTTTCTPLSHKLAKSLIRIASTRIFANPEQSILELPVNSLDAYNPERKVGKFGIGFFSILYWLVERPKREMIINSYYKDKGSYKSYICRVKYTAEGKFMFNLNYYNSNVIRTGTHILLDCANDNFSDHNVEQFQKELSKIRFTTSKLVAFLGPQQKGESLYARFTPLNQGPVSSKSDYVFTALNKSYLEVVDYASGIPLQVLLTSLFVPSISTKTIQLSSMGGGASSMISSVIPSRPSSKGSLYILVNEVSVVSLEIDSLFDVIINLPSNTRVPVSRDDVLLSEREDKDSMIRTENQLVAACIMQNTFYPVQLAVNRYLRYTVMATNRKLFAGMLNHMTTRLREKYTLVEKTYYKLLSGLIPGCMESRETDIIQVQRKLSQRSSHDNLFEGKKVIFIRGLAKVTTSAGLPTYLFIRDGYQKNLNWQIRLTMISMRDSLVIPEKHGAHTSMLVPYYKDLVSNNQLPKDNILPRTAWPEIIRDLTDHGIKTLGDAGNQEYLKKKGVKDNSARLITLILPKLSPLIPLYFFANGIFKSVSDIPKEELIPSINRLGYGSVLPKFPTVRGHRLLLEKILQIRKKSYEKVLNWDYPMYLLIPRPKSLSLQESLFQLHLRLSALETRMKPNVIRASFLTVCPGSVKVDIKEGVKTLVAAGKVLAPWTSCFNNSYLIYAALMGYLLGPDEGINYANSLGRTVGELTFVSQYGTYAPIIYVIGEFKTPSSPVYAAFLGAKESRRTTKEGDPIFKFTYDNMDVREIFTIAKKEIGSPYLKALELTKEWNLYITKWGELKAGRRIFEGHHFWDPYLDSPICALLEGIIPTKTLTDKEKYKQRSRIALGVIKVVDNCYEFVMLMEIYKYVNNTLFVFMTGKIAGVSIKAFKSSLKTLQDRNIENLCKQLLNVSRLYSPQGARELFGSHYNKQYGNHEYSLPVPLLDKLARTFHIILKQVSNERVLPIIPIGRLKELIFAPRKGVTITENKLIDYVSKNPIPKANVAKSKGCSRQLCANLEMLFKKVSKYRPQRSLKLQIAEIAINEGATKDFINSMITETAQNSLDAISESRPRNKNIEITIQSKGSTRLLYSIKDHVGIPDVAVLALMIPFLSSKSPSAIVTGELGSGFFNVYRKSQKVVTRSVRDGRLLVIGDTPMRDKLGRTIDITRSVEISRSKEPNYTKISVVIPCKDQVEYNFYASGMIHMVENVLSMLDRTPILFNGVNISTTSQLLLTTPNFIMRVVKSQTHANLSSYIFTKRVPFAPLEEYFGNKEIVPRWVLSGISSNLVMNIKHGVFTPVQTRQKLNISPTNMRLLKDFLWESLYVNTIRLVSTDSYVGNLNLVLKNFKSPAPLSQVVEIPQSRLNLEKVNSLATFMYSYNFRSLPSIGECIWEAKAVLGDNKTVKQVSEKSILEKWDSPSSSWSWSTHPVISKQIQTVTMSWLTVKNTKEEVGGGYVPQTDRKNPPLLKQLTKLFRAYVQEYWTVASKANVAGITGVSSPGVFLKNVSNFIAYYDPGPHSITISSNDKEISRSDAKIFIDCLLSSGCSEKTLVTTVIWKKYFSLRLPSSTLPHEIEHARRNNGHQGAGAHSSVRVQFPGDSAPKEYEFNQCANKVCEIVYLSINFIPNLLARYKRLK